MFKERIENVKITPIDPKFVAVSLENMIGHIVKLEKEHIEAWQNGDKDNEIMDCEISVEEHKFSRIRINSLYKMKRQYIKQNENPFMFQLINESDWSVVDVYILNSKWEISTLNKDKDIVKQKLRDCKI